MSGVLHSLKCNGFSSCTLVIPALEESLNHVSTACASSQVYLIC